MKSRKSPPRDKGAVESINLSVRIQPRASKNEIIWMENGGLKIRLTSPPVDGAANEMLIRFLADTLAVAKSQVEIVHGKTSRDKVVRVSGLARGNAEKLLIFKEKRSIINYKENLPVDAD